MEHRFEVVVTEPALADLDEIIAYHTNVLAMPNAASKLLASFEEIKEELEQTPMIFLKVRDYKLASLGYRWAPLSKSYAVFYRIDSAAHIVTIDRILYQPRKWQAILMSDE